MSILKTLQESYSPLFNALATLGADIGHVKMVYRGPLVDKDHVAFFGGGRVYQHDECVVKIFDLFCFDLLVNINSNIPSLCFCNFTHKLPWAEMGGLHYMNRTPLLLRQPLTTGVGVCNRLCDCLIAVIQEHSRVKIVVEP